MFTHCPNCEAVYRLDAATLAQAGGQVRCGRCAAVFFALEYLHDTAEEALAARTVAMPEGEAASPSDVAPVEAGEGGPESDAEAPEPHAETVAGAETEEAAPENLAAELLEEEAQGQVAAGAGRFWGWVAIIALLLTLGGQVVYFKRHDLALNPLWRPAVEVFCGVLGCDLPLRRAPGSIAVIDRSVREHPRVAGALLVNATIVNQADFPQPYPFVGLRISGVAGGVEAGRWFRPEEYLPGGEVPEGGMAPGVPVHVMLEILDPGTGAEVLSYRFDFL